MSTEDFNESVPSIPPAPEAPKAPSTILAELQTWHAQVTGVIPGEVLTDTQREAFRIGFSGPKEMHEPDRNGNVPWSPEKVHEDAREHARRGLAARPNRGYMALAMRVLHTLTSAQRTLLDNLAPKELQDHAGAVDLWFIKRVFEIASKREGELNWRAPSRTLLIELADEALA